MRLNALNAGQNFELTSQRRKRKDAPEFIRGWRGRGPRMVSQGKQSTASVTREEARPGCPQCGQEMVAAYDKAPEGGIPPALVPCSDAKDVWECDP